MEGVLGRPLFDRFVVDIDYAARRITFHEPREYRYQGGGEALSLQLADDVPVVDARVAATSRSVSHSSMWRTLEILRQAA
jgi:hypothetical protein